MKLIMNHVESRAVDHGCRALHLGGGLGASEDLLYRFKRGFSTWTRRLRNVGFILDTDRFEILAGTVEDHSDYFPLYQSSKKTENAP